jgi:hypothetical protein
MESSISTQQFEPATEPEPAADPVATDLTAATDAATATNVTPQEVHPSITASIREQCSACGAAMASDQRYCVECGQRRGSARVPMLDGLAQRGQEASTDHSQPRRRSLSVNSTLIAGVGTLLLAMGIGVLIGRSGNNTSAKSPPAQIVTVAGAGAAATSPTATQPASGVSATSTSKAGESHATGAAKSSAKSTPKKAAAPIKAVKVGSSGHGKGYQKGHFTGNFFGE